MYTNGENKMKFESYDQYVEAAKIHFNGKLLGVPSELMILPKNLFDKFNGVIEFGPGSKHLLNKKCDGNCKCETKCQNHVD